jgi:plasmid stability protein
MATVTIPDDLHARLKERAQRNGRSVDQQIIADLANGTDAAPIKNGRLFTARDRMRRAIEETDKIRAGMKSFMTAEEIDTANAEGKA